MALSLWQVRAAHACNPYQATFQTSVAPDNPMLGTLYYTIQSTCTNNTVRSPQRCGGSFNIPPFTIVNQKCELFAQAVANTCGATSAGFVVTDNCAASGSFTVTDPGCTTQMTAGDGLLMGISNDNGTLAATDSSATVDYEFDTITPGCNQAGNGDVGVIKHPASGQSISGAAQGGVTASAVPPGGFAITERVVTHSGDSPVTVLNGLASLINGQNGGVRCEVRARALQCQTTTGAVSVPLALQIDDVALSRFSVSGPPLLVQKLVSTIDTSSATTISGSNIVFSSSTVPAAPAWAIVFLACLLVGAGTVRTLQRRRRGAV